MLENYLEDNELNREQLRILTRSMEIEHVSVLMAVANYIRRRKKGDLISFSKNVFIPLTQLCRDQCSYCTFKIEPGEGELLVPPEKVLDSARKAAQAGCTELLFVSGDKPEIIYDVYKDKLKSMGYNSTADYMISIRQNLFGRKYISTFKFRNC